MANWVISGMLALGIGTWAYTKMSKRSNTASSSWITAGFVALVVFIVSITFLKVILHN